MFPEYVAYLAAQRCEEMIARGALPDAPVQEADRPQSTRARLVAVRTWVSADLRRLADRLDPAPRRPRLAAGQRR